MTPAWQLPARARLTLWYVLLLGGTQLALGGLALWLVGRALYTSADDVLRTKAAAVETETESSRGRLIFEAKILPGTDTPVVAAGLDVVRLWDRRGRLVYQLEHLPGLEAEDPSKVEAILAGQTAFARAEAASGAVVRLYAEPIRDSGKVIGAIQVGRAETEIEAILTQLRLLGAGGGIVALLLACGGGYFLAGRALAPVDRVTRAAERIGAEDLSRRLALPLPDDEIGRLVRAFDRMIDRLDQAFQRQRRFTADAAHELRTPLAIILAQLEAARDRPREAARDARLLNSLYEESQRLEHLVDGLLALARADAGQPMTLASLDLEELLADVSEQVAPRAHARGVQLTVTVEPTAPVHGDAAWLTQLLLNLLDNALRHTPAGGRVGLALEPARGGILLRVADTGEGVPAEHLPHLGERFYRVDPARGRATGGSGLGLAICEWVAQAHGGRLEIASRFGHGTTVSLWMPAAERATDGTNPGNPPVLEPTSLAPDRST